VRQLILPLEKIEQTQTDILANKLNIFDQVSGGFIQILGLEVIFGNFDDDQFGQSTEKTAFSLQVPFGPFVNVIHLLLVLFDDFYHDVLLLHAVGISVVKIEGFGSEGELGTIHGILVFAGGIFIRAAEV
jgi:hypothetical protein